jgi:hypothetical protein
VELLISTLEKGGDITAFGKGLERCYKTVNDFRATKGHEAFSNKKLVDMWLQKMKKANESSLPSFLIFLRRLTWTSRVQN